MLALLEAVVGASLAALRPRASLIVENLVLRQQLAILRRATSRPRLRPIDRAFWVVVCRLWSRWSDALAIVRPATVIAWHRRGFASFWAWKSRRVGRPQLAPELVRLIERMSRENPLWSGRRIAYELAKLGHCVDSRVAPRVFPGGPPQIRTCRFPASGSSRVGFATCHTGAQCAEAGADDAPATGASAAR
jgi:putative transposase